MTVFAHTHVASERSVAVRRARADLRYRLRTGATSIVDVLRDPPACVLEVRLCDVLMWAPLFGPWRLERLGARACRSNVNLVIATGRSSVWSRLWLVGELER